MKKLLSTPVATATLTFNDPNSSSWSTAINFIALPIIMVILAIFFSLGRSLPKGETRDLIVGPDADLDAKPCDGYTVDTIKSAPLPKGYCVENQKLDRLHFIGEFHHQHRLNPGPDFPGLEFLVLLTGDRPVFAQPDVLKKTPYLPGLLTEFNQEFGTDLLSVSQVNGATVWDLMASRAHLTRVHNSYAPKSMRIETEDSEEVVGNKVRQLCERFLREPQRDQYMADFFGISPSNKRIYTVLRFGGKINTLHKAVNAQTGQDKIGSVFDYLETLDIAPFDFVWDMLEFLCSLDTLRPEFETLLRRQGFYSDDISTAFVKLNKLDLTPAKKEALAKQYIRLALHIHHILYTQYGDNQFQDFAVGLNDNNEIVTGVHGLLFNRICFTECTQLVDFRNAFYCISNGVMEQAPRA